ncbi:MAG: HlyC/CorC family transporter [Nitrospinae bacterium]|nr:HlyC/CorC family transporter [Nitrospinota bacterium]
MDEITLLVRLGLLAALMAGSAFFSGSEIALFSLSNARVMALKESAGRRGARIAALLESPQRLLVTIYIGNELINVAISAIITVIALDLFENVGVALTLGAGVFALLVFCEITPKAYAHDNSELWALAAAHPLSWFMTLIWPAQSLVTWIATLITRPFGGAEGAERGVLSEDEFKLLMEKSAGEGVLGAEEKEMIQNVFELGDVTVGEIMTPRTDIVALEADEPLAQAWETMAQSKFARAPVYEESIDNVIGVLFKKDLLKLPYPPPPEITLRSLLREPFVAPQTIRVKDLLREFKKRKTHMAIVMDEYGGVQGVATMDDVLEELFGESSGPAQKRGIIARLGGGQFLIPASLELEEFNEFFDTRLSFEEIETIGGYVFHLFGRAPKWGESIESDGFRFIIEKVKGHRILQLRVSRASAPAPVEE